MKRISKPHLAQIAAAQVACTQEAGKLIQAIEVYNNALEEQRNAVAEVLGSYNEKLADLKTVYDEVAQEARAYYEERSEKWQDGEAGQEYAEWVDQLEYVELEAVDLDLPENLELDVELLDFTDDAAFPPEAPGGAAQ